MTNKLTEMFAKALNKYHDVHVNGKWGFDREDEYFYRGVCATACNMANLLEKDNSRFDRKRFLEACKVPYPNDYSKF